MDLPRVSRKLVETLSRAGAVVAGVGLVVMMLLDTGNAIGRKMGRPVPDALEMSESIMFAFVFLGIAYVAMRRGHVNVEMFTRSLSPRAQAAIDTFAALMALAVFGMLTWSSWELALEYFARHEVRLGIFAWPVWPFRFILSIGLGLIALQLIANTVISINKARGVRQVTEQVSEKESYGHGL